MRNEGSETYEHYATALLSLALAADQIAKTEEDLSALQRLVAKNEELRRFVTDPLIRIEGKILVLRRILGTGVSELTLRFLEILVVTGAIRNLDAIVESFFQQLAARRRKISGELVSPVPIPPEKVAIIEKEASRILGKDVKLRVVTDPDLLGGLYLRVGDFVIDGTIDRQMKTLAASLRS
ncbi:MAG: ATP synthase F1 subunit delta [Kiritimatiellia bacterium]